MRQEENEWFKKLFGDQIQKYEQLKAEYLGMQSQVLELKDKLKNHDKETADKIKERDKWWSRSLVEKHNQNMLDRRGYTEWDQKPRWPFYFGCFVGFLVTHIIWKFRRR